MTASISGAADESRQEPGTGGTAPGSPTSTPEAPSSSVSLVGGAGGDRCQVCEAGLTPEQRYCVECGTRRGKPRFTAPKPREQGSPAALVVTSASGGPRISNAALAAAVAIVLLALGIGFLIGDAASSQTIHVTVAGASAGTSGKSSTTASGATKTTAAPPPTTSNSTPFAN